VAQAFSDWALHLAASPGKRLDLVGKAVRQRLRLADQCCHGPNPEHPGAPAIKPCHRITASMIRPGSKAPSA
jgi:polyhydroxyalkanoate synthase